MRTDPRLAQRYPFLPPELLAGLRVLIELQRASGGASRMIRLVTRRTKQNVQSVPNDLGDSTVMFENNVRHTR